MRCHYNHECDDARQLPVSNKPEDTRFIWVCRVHYDIEMIERAISFLMTGVSSPVPYWEDLVHYTDPGSDGMTPERMRLWASLFSNLSDDLMREAIALKDSAKSALTDLSLLDSKLYACNLLQDEATSLYIEAANR